ncbi:MAG: DUF4838 domain-containing protein, partial [Oscillochloris sp.]|nr:DUF4838 domain-containing protein [Oscillochloris sp.]
SITLPATGLADRPALAGRSLIIGHDHMLAEAEPWLEWAAHGRLNTIFIHTIRNGPAIGACRLSSWRARRRTLLPRITERGFDLELGGHHLRDLVPRQIFRERPEIFRHNGTQRTPDHNFCPSHPEAQALLRSNGTAFFKAYPEAQVYHLWPDDMLGGGWCVCPRCVGLSPADQALLAANTLAEALADLRPDARVSYLAYHDTECVPNAFAPHPQVELLFAPRPRSYAYGIGDPNSAINTVYAARLAENIALFGNNQIQQVGDKRSEVENQEPETSRARGTNHRNSAACLPPSGSERLASRLRSSVFEYYLDGILFKSAIPPLPEVIAADMAQYRDAGVRCVHVLMTGDRPWVFPPLNAYLFARLAWSPEQNTDALVADYAAARAPHAPAALVRTYTSLGQAWRAALDRTPTEAAQRREHADRYDPVAEPPLDVLDYMAAPRPDCERRLEQLRATEDYMRIGRAAWREVIDSAFADEQSLAAERAEWELGAALLHFLTMRQQLYVLASRAAPRPVLRTALSQAQAALDVLIVWADTYIPARARAGHHLLRTILQLHIDHIADRQQAMPWQRASLRARRATAARTLLADPRLIWELLRRRR